MYIRLHVNARCSCQFLIKLEYSPQILEKYSSFMKILPVGAELFHADGRTGTYEKANSRCSYLSEGALALVVKLGLPAVTVSHYIICTNNRWPLQYVTQTWQCTVRVCTVHVGSWLDCMSTSLTVLFAKNSHIFCIYFVYFFQFYAAIEWAKWPRPTMTLRQSQGYCMRWVQLF
jgi:hypothetical protein